MGRSVPPVAAASTFVARLPEPLRVRAARRAVARLKHAEAPRVARERTDPVTLLLLAGALLASAALGFVAGTEDPASRRSARFVVADVDLDVDRWDVRVRGLPGIGAAMAVDGTGTFGLGGPAGPVTEAFGATAVEKSAPIWFELGQVRAEILRLRVLFRRLAEVARLEDGEFDLELAPEELPEVRDALEALDLSVSALDPISKQSARMARIFDERRGAHDRRIGGRVAEGAVRTSGFGHRMAPHGGRRQLHRGLDLAARPGTPIRALADGVVTWSGKNGGYGNLVELEHSDGFRTRYAHNRSNLVALGERVAKGEVVATLGSSGRSTGPHVHVEVRRHGVALDPARFVR